MPAKKSNRNKKSLKMHSAKKLGSVKPLSVDPSLVTTSVASQPSSHTSTKEIFNFSLGAASPAARGGVPGEGNSNIPNMIVNVSKIKPWRPPVARILTSDFICPLHSLDVPGGGEVILRGSVRVWDFEKRSIVRKIVVGDPANPSGTINVQLIPGDRQLRGFTAGMADNKLYLLDTQHGTAKPVFDFSPFAVPDSPIWQQLFRINRDGTRLFITLSDAGNAGKVVQFDISRPDHPQVLSAVDLGPGSGPHYIGLTKDEKRLVVSDYFLVEDLVPGGMVKAEGDHKLHVFEVEPDRIKPDPRFDLDFNRGISTGPARPHGFAFLPGGSDE